MFFSLPCSNNERFFHPTASAVTLYVLHHLLKQVIHSTLQLGIWGYLGCGETSAHPWGVWVQCLFCLHWSHEACTEGTKHHLSHNCENKVKSTGIVMVICNVFLKAQTYYVILLIWLSDGKRLVYVVLKGNNIMYDLSFSFEGRKIRRRKI